MKSNKLGFITGLLFAACFAMAAPAAKAVQSDFVVTFNHPNLGDPTLEFVVEAKQLDGTFVEVARGGTSPINYSANAGFGTYTVRVYTHVRDGSVPRDIPNDTSDIATETIVPGKPVQVAVLSSHGINGQNAGKSPAAALKSAAPPKK